MKTANNMAAPGALHRSLGFIDLVAYGLAYLAVVAPLTNLGFVWDASGGLIGAAYVMAAVCMYFTAQSYALMSEVVPQCGSVYGFARHGLGPLAGFLGGWMILLDYALTPALVYALTAVSIDMLVPGVDRAVWIVLVVACTLALNWFGTRVTTRISAVAVAAQFVMVGGVVVLALLALRHGAGTGALTAQPFVGTQGFAWSQAFGGAAIAVMTFLGFDAVSTLAEEVRGNDRRMVGRATLTVLAVASVLYVAVAWVIGNLMPAIHIQDPAAAIFELLGTTVGPWAPVLFAWLLTVIVSFTNALPMQAAASRVLLAMGRDRQLPAALGQVHAGSGVPRAALLVSSGVSMAVALTLRDHIDVLASLISFGALAGFALLHLSVLATFARAPGGRRLWTHVLVPAAGMVVVAATFTGMQHAALAVGMVWLVGGLGYGALLRRRAAVVEGV